MIDDKEILARWMMENGYEIGHGDRLGDLVAELAWQHTARLEGLSALGQAKERILELEGVLRVIRRDAEGERWGSDTLEQVIELADVGLQAGCHIPSEIAALQDKWEGRERELAEAKERIKGLEGALRGIAYYSQEAESKATAERALSEEASPGADCLCQFAMANWDGVSHDRGCRKGKGGSQ